MTISTEQDEFKQLSELIKFTLETKGFTQSYLAQACGVSRGHISKLINNNLPYPPSRKLLRAIAQTLNLDEYNLNLLAGHIPLSIKPLVLRFLVVTGDRAEEILQEAIKDAS